MKTNTHIYESVIGFNHACERDLNSVFEYQVENRNRDAKEIMLTEVLYPLIMTLLLKFISEKLFNFH